MNVFEIPELFSLIINCISFRHAISLFQTCQTYYAYRTTIRYEHQCKLTKYANHSLITRSRSNLRNYTGFDNVMVHNLNRAPSHARTICWMMINSISCSTIWHHLTELNIVVQKMSFREFSKDINIMLNNTKQLIIFSISKIFCYNDDIYLSLPMTLEQCHIDISNVHGTIPSQIKTLSVISCSDNIQFSHIYHQLTCIYCSYELLQNVSSTHFPMLTRCKLLLMEENMILPTTIKYLELRLNTYIMHDMHISSYDLSTLIHVEHLKLSGSVKCVKCLPPNLKRLFIEADELKNIRVSDSIEIVICDKTHSIYSRLIDQSILK